MATPGAQIVYDLKGLKCPLPAIKARKKLATLPSGQELVLETTDPLAGIDIPHMCHEQGHVLLASERTASGHRFVIRRGEITRPKEAFS
ncbi:sulfurtransferase TusA family protein [Rhizobium sp. SSA_523]|uniref:sulfurtransferase TusA family protein n=1 Tax=Rhizobium sp. SSA_523 TaxID=2952477 RepID=UPI00209021D1|nr:sulfurtransferase TusA family protein [Rhizobium sp. SSA_523]MCO5733644.1 sulfurtransferase TusA family protein [Rhizobium sp. SSA_523]WKC23061.1 sulfurtransferase TusA family protein [Rhizobium sp. SSA_523]